MFSTVQTEWYEVDEDGFKKTYRKNLLFIENASNVADENGEKKNVSLNR